MQNEFLKQVKHQSLTLFLTNGVKLQGKLVDYDDDCLALKRDDITQLVYKSSLSTIMPRDSVDLEIEGNY